MEGVLYVATLAVIVTAFLIVYYTIEELRDAIKQSKQP